MGYFSLNLKGDYYEQAEKHNGMCNTTEEL